MPKNLSVIICLLVSLNVFQGAGASYLTKTVGSVDGEPSFSSWSAAWMSNARNAKANIVKSNGVLEKAAYTFPKQLSLSDKEMKNLKEFNFHGEPQIAAQYRDLINSYSSPEQIILHKENKESLALLNRNLKELTTEDKEALEKWASKNFHPDILVENERPNEFQNAKAALDWNLKRASAKQDVWWTEKDLQHWGEKNSDETVIIKFGDLFKFDEKSKDYLFKENPVQLGMKLFKALEKPSDDVIFKKRVVWPVKEVQLLGLIKAEDSDKSLLHMRLDQMFKSSNNLKGQTNSETGNIRNIIRSSISGKTETEKNLHQ
ncbi:expressed protein [Phakopsora pachyrhizi]|uniref:Expressed protein n=1 Tax=Phakopsora pachyrhizi TaxID=170000 RepID=A0AAV0AQD9_PHAPC|nr:expressed protein [Phakopsora pachyrhizi]